MTNRLSLPAHFQSGMILQQQLACLLQGTSLPLAEVRLFVERRPFDGRAVSPLDNNYGLIYEQKCQANQAGNFQLELPAFAASFDPYTISLITGDLKLVLEDVLIGEVWLAAGQSNMQMPLAAIMEEEAVAELANLFYVRVLAQATLGLASTADHYGPEAASQLVQPVWLRGDQPQAMANVSAVAFAFAHKLHLDLKIPIAIVETALGGSYIHAWLSRAAIEAGPELVQHLQKIGCYRSLNDWQHEAGWEDGMHQPAALYNSKIAPLKGLGLRGVLWYQGESDYTYPEYYEQAFKALVQDWQALFKAPGSRGVAFYLVQLAPFYYGSKDFTGLARFNEMLARLAKELDCPSAVLPVYDLSCAYDKAREDWLHPIHPQVKLPLGQRLALLAEGMFYQRKAPAAAPGCSSMEVVGNKLLLSFSPIGDGLRLSGSQQRLRGFCICGSDRVFHPAQARILYGVRVLVWHDQINEPVAVTYAFSDLNQESNLISRDGLPVLPFRSDSVSSTYLPPGEWLFTDDLLVWATPDAADVFQTRFYERWRISRGSGRIELEAANKVDGDGSLFLRYNTDGNNSFALEPELGLASLYPPFDLAPYSAVSVQVFNAEQNFKSVQLALATGDARQELVYLSDPQTVVPALRWQKFQFAIDKLAERKKTWRFVFIFGDKKKKGELYLDGIKLIL